MSDAPDPDLPDFDVLAAEYVLGVLPADEAARCGERRRSDPAFGEAVSAWERRLMPLASLAPPVAPPPGLLERIEATIAARQAPGPSPVPRSAPNRGLRRQLWFWRGFSGASLAAACVLAALLWLRPPVRDFAVLLPPGNNAGGYVVRRDGGQIQLRPVQPPALPPGRDLQLWVLPTGAGAPRSLGVLPSAGTTLPAGVLPAGDGQLLVSVEPSGGSPTGQPTGPVVLGSPFTGAR